MYISQIWSINNNICKTTEILKGARNHNNSAKIGFVNKLKLAEVMLDFNKGDKWILNKGRDVLN